MRNVNCTDERPGELGAISIKVLLTIVVLLCLTLIVIKITPVYVGQRQLTFKVEELANKSAVRNSKPEDIQRAIEAIRKEYDLPEHSINLVSREQGRVQISIKYEKSIDLLVTTYAWKVAHTADGKDL
jgi:flagellar basal body-associated protein FliL